MRIAAILIWAFAFALFSAVPGHAEKRVALVIGNDAYRFMPALRNPGRDAGEVEAALTRLGFATTRLANADARAMNEGLKRFAQNAAGAEIVFVFYSGHGAQFEGRTWLLPVDARLDSREDVNDADLLALDRIAATLRDKSAVRIIVLDACRDNPVVNTLNLKIAEAQGLKNAALTKGLARPITAVGDLVVYATQAGAVASDGDGRNSPFTASLLKYIETSDLDVRQLFFRVQEDVARTSKQLPEVSNSIIGEFKLKITVTVPGRDEARPADAAERAWAASKDTTSQAVLEDFIRRYGDSFYATLARARLEELKAAQTAAAPPAPAPVTTQPPAQPSSTDSGLLGGAGSSSRPNASPGGMAAPAPQQAAPPAAVRPSGPMQLLAALGYPTEPSEAAPAAPLDISKIKKISPTEWHFYSVFPPSFESGFEHFKNNVGIASAQHIRINLREPRPPMVYAFNAVRNGDLTAMWAFGQSFADPALCPDCSSTAPVMSLLTNVPSKFATVADHLSWRLRPDVQGALDAALAKIGLMSIPCGVMGPGGVWSRVDLRDDPPATIAARGPIARGAYSAVGATVQLLAGGDFYQALERGVMDAAEVPAASIAEKWGIHKVTKYHFPNLLNPGNVIDLIINRKAWLALSTEGRDAVHAACKATLQQSARDSYSSDSAAILRMVLSGNISVRLYSPAAKNAMIAAAQAQLDRLSAQDDDFKKLIALVPAP
jgi:hypothetical protein